MLTCPRCASPAEHLRRAVQPAPLRVLRRRHRRHQRGPAGTRRNRSPAPSSRKWLTTCLVGIISERDIVHAVADRRDLADVTAGEYMTWEPATVGLDTPLAEVAHRMLAYGVRHLPVVVAGDVLGMVSARDLLEWRAPPPSDKTRPAHHSLDTAIGRLPSDQRWD